MEGRGKGEEGERGGEEGEGKRRGRGKREGKGKEEEEEVGTERGKGGCTCIYFCLLCVGYLSHWEQVRLGWTGVHYQYTYQSFSMQPYHWHSTMRIIQLFWVDGYFWSKHTVCTCILYKYDCVVLVLCIIYLPRARMCSRGKMIMLGVHMYIYIYIYVYKNKIGTSV